MGVASSTQVASGLLSGGSAVGGFINANRQANALITASNFDQKLAALQAADAIARGNEAAANVEGQTRQTVGRARAGLAAQGVSVSGGSAVDIQAQDAGFGALDAQMIRNNAAREAMGYTTEAAFAGIAARQKASSIRNQAYATLATGAARDYGMFPRRRVPGATPGATGTTAPGDDGE